VQISLVFAKVQRKLWEAKEKKKAEAVAAGEEYESDDDEKDAADKIPYITKKMLLDALQYARRSVSKADLEKYMKYKRDMERRLGMEEGGGDVTIVGLDNERRPGQPPPPPASTQASTSAAAQGSARQFGDEQTTEDDDIYD